MVRPSNYPSNDNHRHKDCRSLPAAMAQQSSDGTPGYTSFVFRSRPKTSKRAKPPYTPKREVQAVPRKDPTANWAPGVPNDMLFVHRIRPDNQDKMYACADWNEATGPLEMYEGSFDLSEAIGTYQRCAGDTREDSVDGFSSRSQSSHGYTSSEPQTPIEPMLSPYPALSFPPNNKGFHPYAASSTSGDLHYHEPLHSEEASLVYGKSDTLDGLGYSSSALSPGSGVVTPQAPGFLRLPPLGAALPAPDYSRGSSPGSSTPSKQHCHDDLQSNAHLQYPTLLGDLEHHSASHSHRDISKRVDQGEDRYHFRPPHPKSALFPVDPGQFHTSGLELRRHSLPTISSGAHTLPLAATHAQAFIGPNHSPYYASLMPPRVYPRFPDHALPNGDPRVPGQHVPWPIPSLAQFPGPRRLEHQDAFSQESSPPNLHHFDNHGTRAFTPLSAVTVPLSCPSSPSRPAAYLQAEPGVSSVMFYSAEGRPEMPKRAASWTAHFESLPAPKLAARPRKSRAKGQLGNARKPVRSKTMPQALPPGVVLLHKCPLCPRAFERRNGLAIHLKWHYKSEGEKRECEGGYV